MSDSDDGFIAFIYVCVFVFCSSVYYDDANYETLKLLNTRQTTQMIQM